MNWPKLAAYLSLGASVALLAPARAGSDSAAQFTGIPPFEVMVRNPLSLGHALNIAAAQNSVIKAARSDVEARFGVAIQVRAIVLPKALSEVGYSIVQDNLIETNENSNVG